MDYEFAALSLSAPRRADTYEKLTRL